MDKRKEGGLFIVIPAFNRWEQTRTCLGHLLAGSYTDFSIIVVDHGSTDGTRTGLESEFPAVIRVPGSSDMWWTAATNLGITEALKRGAGTIMLLNNDCYVQDDTVGVLLEQHAGVPHAIIAPVQRNLHTGKILTRPMTSCFLLGFPTLHLPGRHWHRPDQQQLRATGIIIGGRGVLIPAAVFSQVGMLNEEQLPHYGADHDFYLRCRKLGIGLYIAGNTVVDVDESTTTRASQPGSLDIRAFVDSLRNRRSHRNIAELGNLFRLHYPIPGLYPLGVALNLLRYTCLYLAARAVHVLAGGHRRPD
jgi:GT2 family glycosyltransferase